MEQEGDWEREGMGELDYSGWFLGSSQLPLSAWEWEGGGMDPMAAFLPLSPSSALMGV